MSSRPLDCNMISKMNYAAKNLINNMPLKKKILSIVLLGVSVMAIISFGVIQIIDESYKKLLYQTLTESLSYSSMEITDYLTEMEKLSMMLLSDENIQNDLTKIKVESQSSLESMNAIQRIRSNVGGRYQSLSDGILQYITLYAQTSTAYTNILRADETPKEIQDNIIMKANEKNGAPCWITDYMDNYGLFLGRSIKRIESIKLDTLGTILINVDVDALILLATQFGKQYKEMAYLISDKDSILYYTDNLSESNAEIIRGAKIDNYEVIELNGSSYFAVHGNLSKYDWDYFCLVSYDQLAQRINNARMLCAFIIIADLLVVILLSGRLVETLMVHVKRLTDKMQQFARDNTKIPKVNYDYYARGDELGILHRQFDSMSKTTIDLIRENYINEILKKEAQIKALESQMNPHFLYNTLESIKWRAKAIGEKNISDMVEALGMLLRTSLSSKNEKGFSVGKEMEIVNSYITIQKIRYEDRLIFENNISQDNYCASIPKLTIQPLIENAIYYGLETNIDECHISLNAKIDDTVLHFYVKNTGSEIENDLLLKLQNGEIDPRGHGIGLVNIDKRVKMKFGEEYGLSLYNEEDYAVAELKLPLTFVGREIC